MLIIVPHTSPGSSSNAHICVSRRPVSLPLPDRCHRYPRLRICLSVLGLGRQCPKPFDASKSHCPSAPAVFIHSTTVHNDSVYRQRRVTVKLDMSSSNSSVLDMMVPYLHFTGGDNLLFEAWHPSSNGAIAGACIGLVLFAIFERWVNCVRGVLEARWRQQCVPCPFGAWRNADPSAVLRALATMTSSTTNNACHTSGSPSSLLQSSKVKEVGTSDIEEVNVSPLPSQPGRRLQRPIRTIPPFIPSHDIPRGALFAFQALLYYVLMLAVMCVQEQFRGDCYVLNLPTGRSKPDILFRSLLV